jgi:hypothetical protein
LRPLHSVEFRPVPAAVGEHGPTGWSAPFRINRHDNALNTKGIGRSRNQFRLPDRSGIDAHLISPSQQHLPDIGCRANTAADRERHKTLLCRASDHVDHRSPVVRRSGDIEKHQFIGLLTIVFQRSFHRITGVAQLQKFCSFDDASVGDVEARDNSFGQHRRKRG